MIFDKFKAKWDRTIMEVWTLRIVVLALSFVVIILTFSLLIKESKQRTVILPPVVSKPFWATDTKMSAGYLENMGSYLSENLLTFTPQTYKRSLDIFMRFVFPGNYKYINTRLLTQLQDIATLNISEVFYPQIVKVSGYNKIIIRGMLDRFGEGKKSVQKQKVITLTYKVVEGRFYVTSISVR
ncbi:MAG: type IV conjugative transfer system protein TraE [Deltaproteobacteria bacterium]|nr:type IV conjugative transfer system protein TraE [Deltaproteobacteria bacterium]